MRNYKKSDKKIEVKKWRKIVGLRRFKKKNIVFLALTS